MIHRRFVVTCVAVLLAMASLGAQSAADADTKEIQSYRITLPVLKQFVAATRNIVTAAKADPRYATMVKLEAELESLQEKEEPTEADEARAEKLAAELEALEDSMPNIGVASDAKSLSDMEAAIRKEPAMLNAISSAGMAPRDYAKFTLAFFQAAMIHGMQKSGLVKDIPKDLQATVNMDNIKFMEDHQAEITALMAEFQALAKQQ